MGYLPKALGDKFNEERAKFFNAARKTTCPWCSLAGRGYHTLELSADQSLLECPNCHDRRPATDAERQVYAAHTP